MGFSRSFIGGTGRIAADHLAAFPRHPLDMYRGYLMSRRNEQSRTKQAYGEGGVGPDRDRWRAQYRHRGKLHRKGGFKTEADARRWLRRQLTAIETGDHTAPADARRTVNAALDAYLRDLRNRGKKAITQAESHARPMRAVLPGSQ